VPRDIGDESFEGSASIRSLNDRAVDGIRSLFGRHLAILAVNLISSVILARLLSPAEFGLYAIVAFAVTMFTVVGDLGITAAFIQRRESLTDADLHIAFTVQMLIAGGIIAAVWVSAPWLLGFYPSTGPEAVWLARVLVFTLAFNAFRSICLVQLERDLLFAPIARAEVVENLVFQAAVISLAVAGAGLWSFVVAALARDMTGVALLYRAAPWPVRSRFDRSLLTLVRRSFTFQLGAPLNALGEWATPVVVGLLVGPQGVGYIGFAQGNARRPLMIVASVMRVSFPHFSRLQEHPELLREKIRDYLLWFQWILAFWGVSMALIGAPLVEAVFSAKWLPAVPALVILSCCLPLDAVSWLLGYAYTATNRPLVWVAVVAIRSTLMLVLAALFVPSFGFMGVVWAHLASNVVASAILVAMFATGFPRHALGVALSVLLCSVAALALGWPAVAFVGSHVTRPWLQVALSWPLLGLAYLAVSTLLLPRRYVRTAYALARGAMRPADGSAAAEMPTP
jgi:O-antigen/teichoic acid export membrane protein